MHQFEVDARGVILRAIDGGGAVVSDACPEEVFARACLPRGDAEIRRGGDEAALDAHAALEILCPERSARLRFLERAAACSALRSRGWHIASGARLGCDFLVYPSARMDEYHASYAVVVAGAASALYLQRAVRAAENQKKPLLLLSVCWGHQDGAEQRTSEAALAALLRADWAVDCVVAARCDLARARSGRPGVMEDMLASNARRKRPRPPDSS